MTLLLLLILTLNYFRISVGICHIVTNILNIVPIGYMYYYVGILYKYIITESLSLSVLFSLNVYLIHY